MTDYELGEQAGLTIYRRHSELRGKDIDRAAQRAYARACKQRKVDWQAFMHGFNSGHRQGYVEFALRRGRCIAP